LNESQISKFLFTFEGIGVILAGSFLIAYFLRIVLSIFGGVAIILVFAGLLISKFTKRD